MSEALILGTAMIAQATAFAPNYNTAINAAIRLFQLIDRKPKIDSTGAAGLKLVKTRAEVLYDMLFTFTSLLSSLMSRAT